MRKVVPLVFISASAIAAASCSLFVSLDGLSDGGAGSEDSGNDACATCVDGGNGDASPQDSSADANTDAGINPCTTSNAGTAGPRMIQADGYCIDSTEVTVAQYKQFVDDGGAGVTQPAVCSWNSSFAPDITPANDVRCTANNTDPVVRGNFPITCIDWCDAWSYCDWAGKRLCGAISGGAADYNSSQTNSQWYTACATNEDTVYPNDSDDGGRCVLNATATVQVATSNCNGGYPGLTDMVGNVEEWVDSCNNEGELAPDSGGPAFDYCHDEGDAFGENFHGVGCHDDDNDNRSETWAGIGFRCCSK